MTCLLFPGQGLHYVGMGKALAAAEETARRTFAEADAALGFALSAIAFDGPEETLTQTRHAQPAILAHAIAALRVLQDRGLVASAAAGHSLGEWTALVAAGALPFADAIRLVHLRGRLMEEALPLGVGGMLSVLGLEAEVVQSVCDEAAQGEVLAIATFNGGDNIVIAGHQPALARAAALAVARGASGALPLAVTTPFHCPLMQPAADRLREALADVKLGIATIRVRSTIVDAWLETPTTELLVQQVTAPVLWQHAIAALAAAGFKSAVAPGPGKALVGMARRITRGFSVAVKAEPADFV